MSKDRIENITLSLLRIVVGFLFLQHGGQKLFAWFGGVGHNGAAVPLVSQMGLAGVLEFFGGSAILLGLFTRPIAFILSGEMAVAYFQAHFPHAFLPIQNRGELPVLFCFIYLFLAARGGGSWSLDTLIRRRRRKALA